MARVCASVPLRPTEDPSKVERALRNLLPDARIDVRPDAILGETESLDHLRELIRNQKIRDTARSQFLRGRRGTRTWVALSKQAASVGRVNFSAGSPLGDIELEIEADDLEAVIDDVAESTVERKG